MARRPAYWQPLPNATQLRLLRLVLTSPVDRDALAAWTASVDLQNLDAGSVRLLPSLYLRLNEAGIDHPWLAIMRGWYRRSLYRNRLIIHRGLDLVQMLESRGVPTLLLKGCPLIALYYKDPGSRPMGDFDLLIDESHDRGEVETILAEGGQARLRSRSLHADTYVDRDGFEYDLHWYLVPELAVAGQSHALWTRARDVVIEGRRLRTLGSEDHLFHAIVHGMRISDVPPMRWIVDVATITSRAAAAGEPIDWLSVAEQAERAATAVPLARGLGFLLDSGILGAEAKAAHAALAAAPQADALLFNAMMRPPSLAFHLSRPWLLYRRLARLSVSQGPGPTAGFRRFLAELWNLESPQQVPATAWRKFLAQFRANSAEG
jgi:Uncharacterised nucleotidyltransferase